jgi:hypothetical protein
MSKDEMKKLNFIQALPYADMLEAHKIIEKGADVALLYFWYNLHQNNYRALFQLVDVQKQADYYCNRNPDFKTEITTWFNDYQRRNIIPNATNIRINPAH